MRLSRLNALGVVFLAAALCTPAWGANSALPAKVNYVEGQRGADSVLPGTVNYIEGQVAIGGQPLNAQSVGSAELQAGQVLSTRDGEAELLLTPGVFLRVGDNSSVKMISPTLTRTEARVDKGRAMVEVDQIHRANDLLVAQDEATTRLLKTGLYDFDANQRQVRVFKGQAQVRAGDQQVKVKGSHEVTLNTGGKLKAKKFNKKAYEGDLYRFSRLRSDYLAEANASAAPRYVYDGWYGPGWYGPGWYWDSWVGGYTFIPGGGILYSPFGWGFYSPRTMYETPFFFRRFGDHDFVRGRDHGFVERGGVDHDRDVDHDAGFGPHMQIPAPRDAHLGGLAMNAPRPAIGAIRSALSVPHRGGGFRSGFRR